MSRPLEVSHGNTARFANQHGDEALGKLCGLVASDEARHEIGYTRERPATFPSPHAKSGAVVPHLLNPKP